MWPLCKRRSLDTIPVEVGGLCIERESPWAALIDRRIVHLPVSRREAISAPGGRTINHAKQMLRRRWGKGGRNACRFAAAACLAGCSAAGFAQVQPPTEAELAEAVRITEAQCRSRSRSDKEIVVCGTRNQEDPYRIPKVFRGKSGKAERSWGQRAGGAVATGIPNAGTNIGASGAAGTSQREIDAWYAERKGREPE